MAKTTTKPTTETLERSQATRIANDVAPSVCGICGSANRSPYGNIRERDGDGTCHLTGRTFRAMIFRDCTCTNCGQRRCDRFPVYVSDSDSETN